jgi:dTDP-glucose pyrophosphorylase/predicted transcriptional regulator
MEIETSTIPPDASLHMAIATIEQSAAKIALVVDLNRRLVGTVTDGDIRRAILNGVGMEAPVSTIMNPAPRVARSMQDNQHLVTFMRRERIRQVPIVDDAGRLIGVQTLGELLTLERRENWIVLIAGGEGRRLRPLTDDCPKPLLQVGGAPLIETIIDGFISVGFRQFFLAVNYKAEMFEDYFGDGSSRGIQISYLKETTPLGTAGALGLLPDRPTKTVLVMNGDILTRVNFLSLLEFHHELQASGTMCVRDYRMQIPYGVVELRGPLLRNIEEKPEHQSFVNAGIYALEPEAFDCVPRGGSFSMPQLFSELMLRGKICAAYPIREYWVDIGQQAELDRANNEYGTFFR